MESCFPPLAALSLRDRKSPSPSPTSCIGNGQRPQVLNDLDIYYIRQIAHSLQEADLEHKLELELKMREGSTRLLAACRRLPQALEAAKSLLTSNARMTAYMSELQRRRREPRTGSNGPVSSARLSLSDLRLPLMWRDTDHFKNKGDYRRFAVFCLARVGTEIHATTLHCPVDREHTDLTFGDTLVFEQAPADFEMRLEVYGHILLDDLSMASTPRKIKKTLHSSLSRTVGRRLAASLRDELDPSGTIGPHFELMASARLTLQDVDDAVQTHELRTEPVEPRNRALPLFGHFCCRLAARPECASKEVCSGDLQICDSITGNWHQVWARLQGFQLEAWPDKRRLEDLPITSLPITRDTRVQPGTLNCDLVVSTMDQSISLRTPNVEEQQRWLRNLAMHASDHSKWGPAAERPMEVHSPCASRLTFGRQPRQGSLYDQTPIIDVTSPPQQSQKNILSSDNGSRPNIHEIFPMSQSQLHRPTVHEIFGLTPSSSVSSTSSESSSPMFHLRRASSGGRAQ